MVDVSPAVRVERELLPFVRKPHRYAGLEINRVVKPKAEVRFALGFPDLYEIGMSNQGLQLLYHNVNTFVPEVAAERVFLPDEEAGARLRAIGLPLTTLETRTPVKDTDILGISLSYEMAMPGMLEMLDLAGLPIHASERGKGMPVVLIGGSVAYNPEPLAEFIDLAYIGDGEEVVVDIARVTLQAKREKVSREELIRRLAELDGIYRPSQVSMIETPSGRLIADLAGDKPIVCARTLKALKREYFPDAPLVPQIEVTFDRISLEVMRGCTRGCRFCQAGILYRPVRERSVEDIVDQAVKNIAASGYNEISLTSLSTSDYGKLAELVVTMRETFRGQGISLAFPSLRPDSFTREMARAFPGGRKSGLTFAPEAGTQRLRDIINKNSHEEDLLRASDISWDEGYNSIKLYFMIGLPGERFEDLDGIADLAWKVAKLRRRNGQRVTVSVSPFAPKPHTPFQRFGQDSTELLREKLAYLREKFRRHPAKMTGHNPESALFESALARGDRRLGKVVERVWRDGAFLEAWSDRFNPERWYQAYADEGLDPSWYVSAIPANEKTPWWHISKGVTDAFFKKEMARAEEGKTMPDCRRGTCDGCGMMQHFMEGQNVCNLYPEMDLEPSEAEKKAALLTEIKMSIRLRYRRTTTTKWTGHLDLVRIWDRLVRRASVPIAYSQGFHPHSKLSFAPPLPVGVISEDEYVDMDLGELVDATALFERICQFAPEGIEPQEMLVLEDSKQTKLATAIEKLEYGFHTNETEMVPIREFLEKESWIVERVKKGRVRQVDIRQYVETVALDPESGMAHLHLLLDNGATARLDELWKAWGYETLHDDVVRLGMYAQQEGTWKRPLDILTGERIRSCEVEKR